MAKQQVYELENGATIIYQKQSSFNGYSFAVGFRCGAQLDGKYKGLSHALEHMLSKNPTYKTTTELLNNMLKYTIDFNAFTNDKTICISKFSAVEKNVEDALKLTQSMLTKKSFSKAQLEREIGVIKQEIELYKDAEKYQDISALDVLLDNISNSDGWTSLDILGNSKTLNLLTPEILTKYMKRYFNLENLVISVTTNKSLEKVFELCNKYILSAVKPATSAKYIIAPPQHEIFKDINTLVALPNPDNKTISICLLLKERSGLSDDINLEYAYDTIEEYLMNNFGGPLWDSLRERNSLVYTYSLSNMDFGTAKFKAFQATTTATKMRKTISEICKIIREIGLYGVPEKKFNAVKTVLTDIRSATLSKFKTASAESNYSDYINGDEFIDYKKVNDYISKISYENFNEYIKKVYSAANVSVAIEGDFDSRKCYNLLEIEKMLGNYSHVDYKEEFNQPIIEVTPIADPTLEAIQLVQEQYVQQKNEAEKCQPKNYVDMDGEQVK